MSFLVVGASGATGRLLVRELLNGGKSVKAVVRSADRLPSLLRNNPRLTVIKAGIHDLTHEQLRELVAGCEGIGCCLGHNLTFKGMFGHPRRLVTDVTRRLCEAVWANQPDRPVKFMLMNTAGNRNLDIPETVSVAQSIIVGLIRMLVPPHSDNEQAAEYLRTQVGPNDPFVEWAAVRPDSLIDMEEKTEFQIYASPSRSAIFNPGKTSRINVADFMSEMLTKQALWDHWHSQMPVIYNSEYA